MKVLMMLSMLSVALLAASAASRGDASAPQRSSEPVLYEVAPLPDLGGTSSAGFSINDRGWVAGRPTCRAIRSVTRRFGETALTDLDAWDGRVQKQCVVRWPVKNVNGLVAGISQTDDADPNNEDWSCSGVLPPGHGNWLPVSRVQVAERRDDAAAHARWHPRLRRRCQQRGTNRGLGRDHGGGPEELRAAPALPVPSGRLRAAGRSDPRAAAAPGRHLGSGDGDQRPRPEGISGICDQAVGRLRRGTPFFGTTVR